MVTVCVLALIIGIVAGLRTFMAPVAVSWAANVGWLQLSGTWLGFLGSAWTACIPAIPLTKLSSTPASISIGQPRFPTPPCRRPRRCG